MTTIRIAATSDLHGFLPEVPSCDILVVCGDIGPATRDYHNHHGRATHWLFTKFADWLESIKVPIVGIAGNHDMVARTCEFVTSQDTAMSKLPWNYLCDNGCEIFGVKFWGIPWTPKFGDWAFMADDEDLVPVWDKIPDKTDVLLTHGPPRGLGDRNVDGEECGSLSMRKWRDSRIRGKNLPQAHFFGHIHEGAGSSDLSSWYNVSHVDRFYQPAHAVNVFEIEI